MFVLKNAWATIGRHRIRALLMVLISAAVALCSMIGLSVVDDAHTAQTTTYDELSPAATTRLDREAVMRKEGVTDPNAVDWTQYRLSLTQLLTYAQNTGLQFSNAYYSETATLAGVEGLTGANGSTSFTLTAFSAQEATGDTVNGGFKIVEGSSTGYDSDSAGKVLVPESLADANGLKAGDTISITPSEGQDAQEVTISGIYRNNDEVDAAKTGLDPDTAIYGSAYVLSALGLEMPDQSSTQNQLDVTFVLYSPSDYEKFKTKMYDAGLSRNYVIASPTITAYNEKIQPLVTLASQARIALVAIGVVGAVLALLVLGFGLAGRTAEIGFFTAVGVGRGRVGWQFALEVLFPLVLGWVVGMAAGVPLCGPVANLLAGSAQVDVNAGTVWTLVWIGVAACVVAVVVCFVRAAAVRLTTVLGSRMEVDR